MKSDRRWPVAIIGAGFSGTLTAAQLARRGIASVLIEGGGRAGQGIAYSTHDSAHLLNVPAGKMSAWPDRPDDFAAQAGEPAMFAERRAFGTYLGTILDQALANGTTLIEASAVGAARDPEGWRVTLEDGSEITADALVLATGNLPPGRLAALDAAGPRLIANPWGEAARAAIAELADSDQPVLIVGTGLTMVDVVLSLHAAGHEGRIVAMSRRGLIPRGHAPSEPSSVELGEIPAGSVAELLRWLRDRAAAVGWRSAVDSLRPHSAAIWQAIGPAGQARFLRHARPYWDVHRHRIAPQVAQLLVERIAGGRLQVVAGRIADCAPGADGVEVTIRARTTGGSLTRRFAYVFNCTGPLGHIARTDDPLLADLLDSGLAKSDHLGMGLAVDAQSRVAGAPRLWAVGPLTKGCYWEIVAVPDIRGQAAAVAADIAKELA